MFIFAVMSVVEEAHVHYERDRTGAVEIPFLSAVVAFRA